MQPTSETRIKCHKTVCVSSTSVVLVIITMFRFYFFSYIIKMHVSVCLRCKSISVDHHSINTHTHTYAVLVFLEINWFSALVHTCHRLNIASTKYQNVEHPIKYHLSNSNLEHWWDFGKWWNNPWATQWNWLNIQWKIRAVGLFFSKLKQTKSNPTTNCHRLSSVFKKKTVKRQIEQIEQIKHTHTHNTWRILIKLHSIFQQFSFIFQEKFIF